MLCMPLKSWTSQKVRICMCIFAVSQNSFWGDFWTAPALIYSYRCIHFSSSGAPQRILFLLFFPHSQSVLFMFPFFSPMDVPSNLPIFHLVLFFSSRITGVISLIFFPSSIYFSLCPHCLLFCSLSLSQWWSHFQDVRDAECHTHLYGWIWLLKGDNGTHPDVSPLVVWAL